MRSVFLILLFVLLFPIESSAIYKWIDKDGAVHFSDTPPEDKSNIPEIMKETKRLKKDEFDGGKLINKWMFLNNDNGSFDGKKNSGFLTIESKAKSNIWTSGIFSPIIYQQVDAGMNFTVETKMEYPSSGGEKAGFVIWSIFNKNWITFAREENRVHLVTSTRGEIYEEIKRDIPAPAGSEIYLKIEKTDMRIICYFSLNGLDWNHVGDSYLKFDNYINLGVFVASWGDKQASAKFDYFKVY